MTVFQAKDGLRFICLAMPMHLHDRAGKLASLLNKIQFTFEVVPCLILSLFRRFFRRCAPISAQSY